MNITKVNWIQPCVETSNKNKRKLKETSTWKWTLNIIISYFNDGYFSKTFPLCKRRSNKKWIHSYLKHCLRFGNFPVFKRFRQSTAFFQMFENPILSMKEREVHTVVGRIQPYPLKLKTRFEVKKLQAKSLKNGEQLQAGALVDTSP